MRWKQGTTVLLVGTALVGGVLMPGAGADDHDAVGDGSSTTTQPTTTTTAAAPTTTQPTTTTTAAAPTTTQPKTTTTTTRPTTTTTTTQPTTTTTTTRPTTTTSTTLPEPEPVDVCGGSSDAFEDDEGLLYEASINCLFEYELVVGVNDAQFQPNVHLRREQAATILVNYAEKTEEKELVARPSGFTDIAGSVHEENIDKGFSNDIINGYVDNTFRPTQLVSREQFVTLLVQTTEVLLGEKLATDGRNQFTDDNGSIHESNIEKAHDNGLLTGIPVDGSRFVVQADVTRGEAAHMMANALSEVLAPAGAFTP